MARWVGHRASPDALTWLGLPFGIAAAGAAWQGLYGWAFCLFAINRVLDGLDGAVARMQGRQSDFGGLLDIILDFVAYAVVAIGLAVGRPAAEGVLVPALFMMAGFYVNAAAWMYLSAILEKRSAGAAASGEPTSVTMPPGLIGGTESMAAYAVFLLFPGHLRMAFGAFGLLVAVTAIQRMVWARRVLGR